MTRTTPNIWGRVYAEDGTYTWVNVTPDDSGNAGYVYITNLIQVLKLNTGESPFFAQYGIPAQQSVIQQIFPDWYVHLVQTQFQQFFAALTITKQAGTDPVYRINATLMNGTKFQADVPV